MTEKSSSENNPRPSAIGDLLITASAFALSVGFLDIIASLLHHPRPRGFSTFFFMLPPLAATAAAAAVVFVVGGLPAALALAGLFRSRVRNGAASVAVFGASLFLLACLADLIPFSRLAAHTSKGDLLIKLGLLAVPAFLAGTGTFLISARAETSAAGTRLLTTLGLSAPFVAAECWVVVWMAKFRLDSLFSKTALPVLAGFGLALLVTLGLFLLAGRKTWCRSLVLLLFVVVLAGSATPLAVAGGQSKAAPGVRAAEKPVKHVIFILVDTLRSGDCVGCLNPASSLTPNIDSLADDAMLFRRTVSPGPWTVPAMASILTGVSPLTHGQYHFGARLPDEFKTMAEYFDEGGYYTGRIGENGTLASVSNFGQGFRSSNWFPKGEYEEVCVGSSLLAYALPNVYREEATTAQLFDLATDWIAEHEEEAFFLWLHIYDPHMPFTPPDEFLPEGPPPAGMTYTLPLDRQKDVESGDIGRTQEERDWIRRLYEGEVRYVDEELGRFVEQLKKQKLYDDALIVLASDHGEEFWEHGGFAHGQSLYGELLNVPLMFKLPGSGSKGNADSVVSTESIMPTMLDLCGIERDRDKFWVDSLVSFLVDNSTAFSERPVLSTGLMKNDQKESITSSESRFIQSQVTGKEELYDLASDPGEQRDISASQGEAVERARATLRKSRTDAQGLRASLGLSTEEREEEPLDEDTADVLRSMGYLN